mmetsp:Transcript_61309/g.115435  ORF Transcript_61309/g.115435 Transcript_61309/m.115435 type:complete len:697 (-) Transcript_61309:7-2097(-)
MSAHDDGLYLNFYADYSTEEDRMTAEQELLYSILDEERSKAVAADAVSQQAPEAADEEEKVNMDGIMFVDPDFVAGGSSLYRNPFQPPRGAMPAAMIEWNRVSLCEIEGMAAPALFGPGVPGTEEEPTGLVVQGALKNCWLIGALAVLATKPALAKALFVSDPEQFGSKGFHTLRFFKCGVPRYVHIDDRVPCNRAGRAHYARSLEANESWVMLAEKAYAKLHGCYENLTNGTLDQALRDLTGWPTFKHELNGEDEDALWETLQGYVGKAGSNASWLMALQYCGAGTPGSGVLAGHSYSVLEIAEVHADATAQFDSLDVRMVKLFNPWGMADWTGDWCSTSELWANYPEIKKQCFEADGDNAATEGKAGKAAGKKKKGKAAKSEFDLAAEAAAEAFAKQKAAATMWMSWEDVCDHFTQIVSAVNVRPPNEKDGPKSKGEFGGSAQRFRGRWVPGDSKTGAGGSPEHVSWPQNPQYAFEVTEQGTTVAVTLSTADTRFQALDTSATSATTTGGDVASQTGGAGEATGGSGSANGGDKPSSCIGFVVMGLTGVKVRSTKFHPLKMKAAAPSRFSVCQHMSGLCTLRAGRYAVVPSTYDPEQEATNFVLEISSSAPLVFEGGGGDELPDADELEESDDEELGPMDDLGVELMPPDLVDPENSGKELEALSGQVGELASLLKTLISDIKGLETRVETLMP